MHHLARVRNCVFGVLFGVTYAQDWALAVTKLYLFATI